MGQKIIPISLRLLKKKNWKSNWISLNKDYSNIFIFTFELKKYLILLFNKNQIYLQNIKINKNNQNYLIYLYIYTKIYKIQKNKFKKNLLKNYLENKLTNLYLLNIKIFIINLNFYFLKKKKILKRIYWILKKKSWLKYRFRKIRYLLHIIILTKNTYLLSIIISKMLKKKKYQKKILFNICNDLNNLFFLYVNFLGYKIQLKGKINGKNRSKKLKFQQGQIPLNTLKKNIYYTMQNILTSSGICSIKIWMYFNK